MKKILLTLFIVLGSISMQAQELEWHTDMNKAMELSQKNKKPLLLFFTGSDWCGWCMRLQKEVLKTEEFAKWANDNVILVELDFPKRTAQSAELKQQNASLARSFAVQGYPTVWFVDVQKGEDKKPVLKQLGKTGYVRGGASAWLEGANAILDHGKTQKK